MSVIGSYASGGGGGGTPITTLLGDVGSASGASIKISGGTTGFIFTGVGNQLTASFSSPLPVVDGGTGNISFNPNGLIVGGVTSTGPLQNLPYGTAGQLLTSQGSGNLPQWASPSSSSVTITGDTGAPITSGSFTFTGGSTGLAFGGSGTTQTLSWISALTVPFGGTGSTTFPAHSLLVGNTTSAFQTVTAGTNGQVLLGATGANPAFVTPTATAGGNLAVTANSTTLSYGISAPVTFANGGTGRTTTPTANAIICGPVSAGTALQDVGSVGTSGQILASQGTGNLPHWINAPSGNITLTGDTGGALTNSSFTISGGSTFLHVIGSGSTLSLGYFSIIPVSTGGTGTAAFNANEIVIGNGFSALSTIPAGTNGQVILGATSASPTFVTPTATAGGNLAVTSNATTLSYGISAPVTLVNGGTGNTVAPTNYALICGPATAGTALQDVGALGTSGQLLASQGAGNLPHWINAPSGNITITGDSGGALSSASFTFTGAGTPFTFVGSGSTQTLTWNSTVGVANGGTGRSTLTANAVLLGNGTTGINSVGPATNGQILIGTTSSAPTFITPTATAGGNLAVTANATTLSYGISAPVTFANGGTGNTSAPTSYAVVCGPTGAGTALQNVSGLGTATQVLTSSGPGALPVWANAPGGSISITGDSGGALSSTSFTFTGGSTPFTFVGAGSTQTLTWNTTVSVSHGGTGAATLTANAVLLGNGTSAVASVGPATNGQILIGTTSAAPTFITPTATAGGNLAVTANATTLSYGISAPVTFANGGTGLTTAPTAYSLVCGPVTAGTALQNVSGLGSATQVLTSNGAAALPTWQNATSSISITGDSGGALTGSSFTFTGGTTPFTFVGSGATETLTWNALVPVNHGGTGVATLTANAVLLGNGTSAVASVGPATNGQILIGTTSAAPTFITPTATAGGNLAVTANATTLSYGISAPVTFANGGTGLTTGPTAYSVICGPVTAGTALQNVSGVGSATQVLTSNGASALPTWQAAASSISITGNTGGALTGSSFTFSGGTTGLSFGGSGTTETLTFAGITANAGTVNLGTDNAANGVNIGLGTTARTIKVGNSAAAHTVQIGSTTGAAGTYISGGTGGINFLPTSGNFSSVCAQAAVTGGTTAATLNARFGQITFAGLTTAAQTVLGTGIQALSITNSFADASVPSFANITIYSTNASGNGARCGLIGTVLSTGGFSVLYINMGSGALGTGDLVVVNFWIT